MNTLDQPDSLVSPISITSCQGILSRIQKARKAVCAQFRHLIADHGQALRLALNEAEALAWQTPAPHLFFPDLAEEKARSLAAWSERQRAIRAAA